MTYDESLICLSYWFLKGFLFFDGFMIKILKQRDLENKLYS